MHRLLCVLFTLGLLATAGCAHQRPVPELAVNDTLAPAYAHYETRYEQAGSAPRQLQWKLWRDGERLVTENLTAQTAELWQRDGEAVFHLRIFHEDQRSIEFRNDDLEITATAVNWPQRSMLVDPQLLQQLSLRRAGWQGDVPYRRYVGEVDQTQWDITLRTDLMLPIKIVRTHDRLRETTTLHEAHALAQAPAEPTRFDTYEVIDFADLGDRVSDPFVVKVQSQLGVVTHTH
jgi:hypothetical protein